jgi:hypothetical protein
MVADAPLEQTEEATDAAVAYARVPDPVPTRYREGWLPGLDIQRPS